MKGFMFAGGFVWGALFMAVLGTVIPGQMLSQAKEALAECERALPRDQTCRLIAVPKENKNEY